MKIQVLLVAFKEASQAGLGCKLELIFLASSQSYFLHTHELHMVADITKSPGSHPL